MVAKPHWVQMNQIELDLQQFGLSQSVMAVPGLKRDTLQNWDKLGILTDGEAARSSKNVHLKRSIRDLIILRIMADLAKFDMKPSRTIKLARFTAGFADEFLDEHGQRFGRSEFYGVPQFLFAGDIMENYRRVYISANSDGTFSAELLDADVFSDNEFRLAGQNSSYVVVEADLTFAHMINRCALIAAGIDIPTQV
jgi:hypothetical protein